MSVWCDPFPLVISGPAGAGKTTVAAGLVGRLPSMWHSVSATTRPARPGEVAGRDYLFLTEAEFESRRATGGFLEWAEVHGRFYGTPREPFEAALGRGELPLLEIDVQGGLQIRDHYPEAVLVFLLPPRVNQLDERLRGRGSEDQAEIALRMADARGELEHLWAYDFLVVNERVEKAVEDVADIVRAEARRVSRIPRSRMLPAILEARLGQP